jgi:hypothetical protein
MKTDFLERFRKNSQISNFMKILPVGVLLLHADRRTGRRTDKAQTDITKPTVAPRNVSNASTNAELCIFTEVVYIVTTLWQIFNWKKK